MGKVTNSQPELWSPNTCNFSHVCVGIKCSVITVRMANIGTRKPRSIFPCAWGHHIFRWAIAINFTWLGGWGCKVKYKFSNHIGSLPLWLIKDGCSSWGQKPPIISRAQVSSGMTIWNTKNRWVARVYIIIHENTCGHRSLELLHVQPSRVKIGVT